MNKKGEILYVTYFLPLYHVYKLQLDMKRERKNKTNETNTSKKLIPRRLNFENQ